MDWLPFNTKGWDLGSWSLKSLNPGNWIPDSRTFDRWGLNSLSLPDLGLPEWTSPNWSASNWKSPDWTLSDFSWPALSWPDVGWPDVGWPDVNWRASVAGAVDGVATTLATRRIRKRPASHNTLSELHLYQPNDFRELFNPEVRMPAVEASPRWTFLGLECTDLEFDSPHQVISESMQQRRESLYGVNDRVHARRIHHIDGVQRPTLLFLHSWLQPETIYEEALLLPRMARTLGVDIVRMQLPYHGRRTPACSGFAGEYFWTADLVRTIEAIRQSVHDSRALLHWIETDTEAPVGAMGMSLGGMLTLALACLEPKLAFAIPLAAHMDLAGILEEAALLHPMRDELQGHGWGPPEVDQFTSSLGLRSMTPCIPTDNLLFVAGKYDRILHSQRTAALCEEWGTPAMHWYEGGHLGLFTHTSEILGVMRGFLSGIEEVRPGPTVEELRAQEKAERELTQKTPDSSPIDLGTFRPV